jgi:hypothetical protein
LDLELLELWQGYPRPKLPFPFYPSQVYGFEGGAALERTQEEIGIEFYIVELKVGEVGSEVFWDPLKGSEY